MVNIHTEKASREEFLEFFRKIINDEWKYEDVMEASPTNVLIGYISPYFSRRYVGFRFVQSKIFEDSICSLLEGYTLKVDDRHEINRKDEASSQTYDNLFKFFNPDLVYSHFDGYEDKSSNLLVLRRAPLSSEQKRNLIQRGESWLKVLYSLEEEIEGFWAWHLSNTVESVVAKVDPLVEREYVHTGKAIGFSRQGSEEYPTVGAVGLIVDGFSNHPCSNGSLIPLVNASDPNRFGDLIGKTMRYHYLDIFRDLVGSPYGELVSINPQIK